MQAIGGGLGLRTLEPPRISRPGITGITGLLRDRRGRTLNPRMIVSEGRKRRERMNRNTGDRGKKQPGIGSNIAAASDAPHASITRDGNSYSGQNSRILSITTGTRSAIPHR